MASLKKPKIKNPELKIAVQEWKENQTPKNEEKMFEELKKAKFIAPVVLDEELPDDFDPSKGEKFETKAKFMLIQDGKGTHFFPAFTEWLEVLKWNNNPDTEPVVVTFDQYAALLLRQNPDARGIVVDPKGMNLMVPTAIFAKAKGLPDANAIGTNPAAPQRRNVNMQVVQLDHYPDDMVERYQELFKFSPFVHAAFLMGTKSEDDTALHGYFITLDMDNLKDDARKLFFDQIGNISKPYSNVPLGIVTWNTEIGKKITHNRKPFYVAEGYELPDDGLTDEDFKKDAEKAAESNDGIAEDSSSRFTELKKDDEN